MFSPAADRQLPEVITERWVTDRECHVQLRSRALARPAEVRVLVPTGAEGAARGAPVLLLLHGADDDPSCWERGAQLPARSAELNAVIVMPTGGAVGFCTDWRLRERPVPGRIGTTWGERVAPAWEQFHLQEVLPWVAHRFETAERRVVLGVSMGGHGAFAYTARHPGTFVAAASFSGVLDTLGRGIPSLIAGTLLRDRQPRHALWGSPITQRSLWEAHNPWDLAERLRGVPLYLARGDGQPCPGDPDAPALAGELERLIGTCTDAMALRLAKLGIAATVSHGQGVHDWPTWNREMDLVWPFLRSGLGL